jgi:hypothetical protein
MAKLSGVKCCREKLGEEEPETFEFLGFTWGCQSGSAAVHLSSSGSLRAARMCGPVSGSGVKFPDRAVLRFFLFAAARREALVPSVAPQAASRGGAGFKRVAQPANGRKGEAAIVALVVA